MRTFFCYLRARLFSIVTILAAAGIFTGIFLLYGVPAEPPVYASMLTAAVLLPIAVIDYLRYRNAHRQLQQCKKSILISDESLPGKDLLLRDYHELLCILRRELFQVTETARQTQEDMMEYYTTWAHQIKTPIAAMLLMLRDMDDASGRELRAQLFKTEQYVEMVLSYLRLGSNSTDFIIKAYPLDEIVRQAVRKYAPFFIHNKLALDLHPISETVLTDEKWLSFVIEQVLSNALKYTPLGSISIYTEPGPILVIADTGIGIAPEDLPRVFENSYTGYNGRMDKRASGIGLYLSRRILQKLGNGISIDSTPGAGTTVRLDLHKDRLGVE